MTKKMNQAGFSHVELAVILVVLAAVVGVGWHVYQMGNTASHTSGTLSSGSAAQAPTVNPTSQSAVAAVSTVSTPALASASQLASGTTKVDFQSDMSSINANLTTSSQYLNFSTSAVNGNL